MAVLRLDLEHERPELTGTVEWDEETGSVAGPLADRIRRMAESAAAAGSVTSHPYPTVYEVGPLPMRSRRDLALIISQLWPVPEPLVEALPEPPETDEAGVEVLN